MNQTFDVQGMTCDHCVRAVTEAVQAIDAHAQVDVDLSAHRVVVQSDRPREVLAKAMASEGYQVR